MEEEEAPRALFDGVEFTIIPSNEIHLGQAEAFVECITANGGRHVPLRDSDQSIVNLHDITHIISTHIDFPQYAAALQNGVSVVKPSWVLASVNKHKQAQARQHSPDPSQYFHDVIVTTADLPEGDKDAIIAGVIALGGQYSGPLSRLVTHIVTNDIDNEKCQVAAERHPRVQIVLPHWFDDCFILGRKINENPYLFPDPELLKENNTSRVRETSSAYLEGATVATPTSPPQSSPPVSPAQVRKNLNAFMSKKVMLSKDLQLSDHLYRTLETLINHGGAVLTDDVEEADIYIGQFRDGDDYIKASRAGKEVANLSWLYHVINMNKYTSPLGKLLHYPVPRNGIPGFENMRISISNYLGDARVYLENLIRYCGAEFTKTMKQDNSHLITAHIKSEKCEAAQEWGINIINHIWLEESYAKCMVQTLTNPRYTRFPMRTNLGEVAGQTSFDMRRLEAVYFPKPRDSPQKQLQAPQATNTKPSPRKTVHSPAVLGTTVNQQDMPTPVEDGDETADEEPQTTKKPRGRPRKSITATPRLRDDEKENESPLLLSSSRASKAKALGMLHQQADDIALYQKEMKRKGGVTHGGRRSSHAEDLSSPAPMPKQRKKRTSDEATYEVTAVGSDLSDGETQDAPVKPVKKAKRNSAPTELPPIQYKMMVTGDDRWLNNAYKESDDRTKLRQLGVQLTQDPKDVDILVAPRILRTRKFVAALSCGPIVVHTKYLDIALKQNKLIEMPDLLEDPENEEKYDLKLDESLERARVNQHKLLRGWTIFVTRDVKGGFDTYKDIISLNGGTALLYQGRTGVTIPKRRLLDDPDAGIESQHQGGEEEFDYIYLVSGESDDEIKLWKTFRDLARKQDLRARVVSPDWLLNAAMRQEVMWDAKWELDETTVMSQWTG